MSGFNNNPFAQGGWINPQNPWSTGSSSGGPPPSIYGALPSASAHSPPKFVEFQCVALNPDITNCMVLGPNARHCFVVATSPASSATPSVTLLRNDRGEDVARIEWYQRPSIEARDLFPKQYVSQFLPLAHDMR
ncbi:hypothetical protein FA15DRAFT_588045 [Coprinopsis marcescibilis]|uniref:Uncharacterized protein n=1 Tax=Coprinopsis marcescibilis TaxID=230819 RepID=A0A5C3LDQ3_COPMA|nr:hypothetical protein FA15DRAFT_588045 [Coprinopsis marcescibilis]